MCQIVSRAVTSEGVLDIFAATGLDKPDISVLSDPFRPRCGTCPNATWPWSCCRTVEGRGLNP